MPSLGDFLGQMMAEVTKARVQADLETARTAELYASHPLLQHMSVPRFRLPNVALDVPLAIETVDRPAAGPPTADQLAALRASVESVIENQLKQRTLQLRPTTRNQLTTTLNGVFDKLTPGQLLAFDAVANARDIAATIEQAFRSDGAVVDDALDSALRQALEAEFLKLQTPPAAVQVMVVTTQLRDISPPQTLTRMQLTITEQGVEWTQTNPSDPTSRTLTPE